MGNGALPHGPSYRAHPRLYLGWPYPKFRSCALSGPSFDPLYVAF
jgi:hypothetical protein